MTCAGPASPCRAGALLSPNAATRRAQQPPRRCNFGELDKLHFFKKKEISPGEGFLRFNARTGVRACSAVGLLSLSLSLSVSPGS